MELYFKDLISEDASLERLVDDLALVVQGAEDYAKAAGVNLPKESRDEVNTHLHLLRMRYQRLKTQAAAGMRATDKLLRAYPYSSLSFAFGAGLLFGWAAWRKK